jgi:hypothetical protein
MLVSVRFIAIVVLGSLSSATGASAQTVAEVASRWGLPGTWQVDCRAPTSRSNVSQTYAVRGGKLSVDRAFGDGTDSSAITAAAVKADGALDLVIIFTSISQTRQLVQIRGSDGRMRAITNRNVDTNDYSVKDGKFTANGNATPWQTRCR